MLFCVMFLIEIGFEGKIEEIVMTALKLSTCLAVFVTAILSLTAMETPFKIEHRSDRAKNIWFYNDTQNVIHLDLRQVKDFETDLAYIAQGQGGRYLYPMTKEINPKSDIIVPLIIQSEAFENGQLIKDNLLRAKLYKNEIEPDALYEIQAYFGVGPNKVSVAVNMGEILDKQKKCGSKAVRVLVHHPKGRVWGVATNKIATQILCD